MERSFGERVPKFSDFCDEPDRNVNGVVDEGILDWLRKNEFGHNELIDTPFGKRRVYYCDYAASGRPLIDIEEYIRYEVLTVYGNTHSSITATSEQSTLFLHEARDVIRNAVGASEHDAVIFTGNGTTAAVELLLHLMALDSPIVISAIHEHHSNLLPWREIASETFIVDESDDGRINIEQLNTILKEIRERKGNQVAIIGCFTAASNITGLCIDVEAVTAILKRWNCISLWDYAAAAPYIDITMNGQTPKDAIYFSGHKFIGGIQTPGVLVVKKKLIRNSRPKRIGGGTVFFVSRTSHTYLKEVEYREEGGTPDVIGAVRLALAFKLKAAVGVPLIKQRERAICEYVIGRLSSNKDVILLGPATYRSRLAIFSFIIRERRSQLFLHHNFVSILLNDLFGIQSRAGCACAGPYAQSLLGIDEELALRYGDCLAEDCRLDRVHLRRTGEYSRMEMLRPGFTRISIPYFASHRMVEFVVNAIEFIAVNATKFMPEYQLNCESGEWHHYRQRVFHSRKWIGFVTFTNEGIPISTKGAFNSRSQNVLPPDDLFVEAERLALDRINSKLRVPDGRSVLDEETEKLRWFLMGSEVSEMQSGIKPRFPVCPFSPKEYILGAEDEEYVEDRSKLLKEISAECVIEANEETSSCVDEEADDALECNGKEEEEVVCPVSEGGEDLSTCCFSGVDEGDDITDDWNRRVVVTQRDDISEEERMRQPWVIPPLELYKRSTEAIHSLNMIQDGDRVLVCLSGGKDSLSLLHVLHHYQQRAIMRRKNRFRLGAITVDPGSTAYNPRPLIEYCRSLNIDYFYEEQNIIGQAARLPKCRSICAFCSRMKRGRIAAAAKLHGYNVLAMGHHLDDLAESFLIAAFQNGNLSTMKAVYLTRDGALRVIRPLIYVREKALREFAESNKLPIVAENCPACFEKPKERYRMKQLLASHELIFPQLFSSLRSALHPLLLVDSPVTSGMRKLAIENIVKEMRERNEPFHSHNQHHPLL